MAEHWFGYAVHRFLADLADGAIVADVDRNRVPKSFWRSDVTLELRHGALLSPFKVCLFRGLQIYGAADAPLPKMVSPNTGRGAKRHATRRAAA